MKKDEKSHPTDQNEVFRQSWSTDTALYILQHPTVDSKIWAEAVEWLLLYGPQEIQELLLSASEYAAGRQFSHLRAEEQTPASDSLSTLEHIAEALQIKVKEMHKMVDGTKTKQTRSKPKGSAGRERRDNALNINSIDLWEFDDTKIH